MQPDTITVREWCEQLDAGFLKPIKLPAAEVDSLDNLHVVLTR